MADILLNDSEMYPADDMLEDTMGVVFAVFERFRRETVDGWGLGFMWNYYRDGRAWLCKAAAGKRTIFWVSVCDGCFQVSIHFAAKHHRNLALLCGVLDRPVIPSQAGRLSSVVLRVKSEDQLADVYKIIEFKMRNK